MTTANADPYPRSRKSTVFWWMYMASVAVEVPGPPRVIVSGMSNVCSAVIVRKISATTMAGLSSGSVISKNWRKRPAPSTSAAS